MTLRIQFKSSCYVKATLVGRGFSEGGTHEETLRPQGLEKRLGSQWTVNNIIDDED